jgi:hypothetical protein
VNVNSYLNYKSKDYYSWINNTLKDYSFPADYSAKSFEDICESKEYSLKPQQKFAARVINTHTDNKGMLIYHGLGSGKTQTSIIIGETFKFRNVKAQKLSGSAYPTDIIQPARTDSVVLIVVPAALVDQYYSEIIGYIEDGTIKSASGEVLINGERQFYLNKKLRNAITQNNESIKELQTKLDENSGNLQKLQMEINGLKMENRDRYDQERKKVNIVYSIISHEKFLNRLFTITDGNLVEGEYLELLQKKNGLLILDEAHGLVSAIGSSYRKLLMALSYYSDPLFRVVLLTGSPIYDKPFEFGLLMNLLRPRIPFPDGFEPFNEVFLENPDTMKNVQLFKMMCSGYVSYFKGGNPEAYPYKKIILMNHPMDAYQYSAYKNALFKEVENKKKKKKESKEEFMVRIMSTESKTDESATSVFNNSRLFCNIAFPEIKSHAINRQRRVELGLDELKKQLKTVNGYENIIKFVKGYSSKFAKVAELIGLSEGPVFVYSNYVYYGVEAMAAIMESLGYKKYPYRGSRGSYFVWKGQADPQEVKKAYKAFNNPANKDGSVLKIMFGTQSVMEGVDFKRVRQVHVLDPWWNDSRMQQVIARAIRLCSHRELPPDKRVVDVFIHLSTLGSGETLYKLKYRKEDNIEKKCFSLLRRSNELEQDPSKWIFYEAFATTDSNGILLDIRESKTQFRAYQILPGSIEKLPDPSLTKKFGSWKKLDTISVEQYMYNRALTKLHLNRQFETAIKEVSIDCDINKNGNIIRLEEQYTQDSRTDIFKLEYVNYSSGKRYIRLNVRSPNLTDNFITLSDIIANLPKNSRSYSFMDTTTKEVFTFPESLIMNEGIKCSPNDEYSFDNKIPEVILNLTINKELIPKLKKISLQNFKKFIFDVEHNNINVSDPTLKNKIKKFYSKQALNEKDELIQKLLSVGVGVDTDIWDLYTTDELKKLAAEKKKMEEEKEKKKRKSFKDKKTFNPDL